MSFENFDIIPFLQDYGINFREAGNNISKNYVGINCPYCGGEGEHFGINRASKVGFCFQCGQSKNLFEIIQSVLLTNVGETKRIIKKYSQNELFFELPKNADKVTLPKNLSNLNAIAKRYLTSRGYDPDEITARFAVRSTNINSEVKHDDRIISFKHRIFIPFIMNNEIVSYTCRSVNDKIKPKYKHAPNELSIVPPASTIYNYDSIQAGGKVIIVEGPTDVWRLGNESVSIQGVTYTKEQIAFLFRKDIQKAVVLFDENAMDKAERLANALHLKIPDVSYTSLKCGDPGELSVQEAESLKWQLLYK